MQSLEIAAMPTLTTDPKLHREPGRLGRPDTSWRPRLYIIICEADTRAGSASDLVLMALILLSVAVIMLDSVESIPAITQASCTTGL